MWRKDKHARKEYNSFFLTSTPFKCIAIYFGIVENEKENAFFNFKIPFLK